MSPEAVGVLGRPTARAQATWSSPATNRCSSRRASAARSSAWATSSASRIRRAISFASPNSARAAAPPTATFPGWCTARRTSAWPTPARISGRGPLSHVTGTHSLKVGYQHTLMTDDRTWLTNTQNLTYRFNNGVPNQLTQSISPWVNDARAGWDGLFVQDHWTRERLTLQGALRFDRARSWFPAQQEGPSRFLPTPIVFPETRGIDSYKDITPRVGCRVRPVRQRHDRAQGDPRPLSRRRRHRRQLRQHESDAAAAADDHGVRDRGRDPSLDRRQREFRSRLRSAEPGAQDLRDSGGDLCGVLSNTSFGTNVLTNRFDPGILDGWGVRPSDWNLGVSIEQQLAPARGGHRGLPPPLVPWILRRRQSGAAAVRPDAVQHRRARRCRDCPAAAAMWCRASTT